MVLARVYVHDCMDAGGRAKQDARAEDVRSVFCSRQKLSTYIRVGNAAVTGM